MTPEERAKRLEKARGKILKILSRSRLPKRDLVRLVGLIGYDLGEAMHGGTVDTQEELDRLYHEQPTLAVAMMCQALTVLSWVEENDQGSSKASGSTEEPPRTLDL